MMMAIARLNLPAVFLYGGTIMPGHFGAADATHVDVIEGVGAVAAGSMSEGELGELERVACPGVGACAGMFTANTMASIAVEARASRCRCRADPRSRSSPTREATSTHVR